MTKPEISYLLKNGFTLSEILALEAGEQPKPADNPADPPAEKPAPEKKPSGSDSETPETASKTPDQTVSMSKPDTVKDPSAEKIAALEAQIEKLQAQLLRTGTNQPGGKEESIEDLVAAF